MITHTNEKPSTKIGILIRKIGEAIKVKRVSKIWVNMFTTNIYLFQFNVFEVTCKNGNFEYQYIRTHTKEKPLKF